MAKSRAQSGATLAFIAATTIIIVLIAIACFFLMNIIGGGRELQDSVDSGNLNVAKDALTNPNVPLPVTNPAWASIVAPMAGLADSNGSGGYNVNLKNFDRFVAYATLVALNADAEANTPNSGSSPPFDPASNTFNIPPLPTSTGNNYGITSSGVISDAGYTATADALSVAQAVEGTGSLGGLSSLGAQLQQKLVANDWPQADFNATSNAFSLRMVDGTNVAQWQQADFHALYDNQNKQAESNVTYPSGATTSTYSFIPFTNYSTATADSLPSAFAGTTGGWPSSSSYMSGYSLISFPSIGVDLMGVPFDPQTHLISLHAEDSPANKVAPQPAKVAVPPNSFVNGATIKDLHSKTTLHLHAAAMSGPVQTYPLSFAYGYIVVDNSKRYAGQYVLPDTNNCFAQELGTGIVVDNKTGFFSNTSPNPVLAWETWNGTGSPPPLTGLYDNNGNAVTSITQAMQLMGSSSVVCTDANSEADVTGSPPACLNLVAGAGTSQTGNDDPCDHAFHQPNFVTNPYQPGAIDVNGYFADHTVSGNNLTAGEQLGASVVAAWALSSNLAYFNSTTSIGNATFANFSSTPFAGNNGAPYQLVANGLNQAVTGMRLYPSNPSPIPPNPPANGVESNPPQECPWFASGWGNPFGVWVGSTAPGPNSYSNSGQVMQVTTDGTAEQLANQTFPGGGTALSNFIKQRMEQILQGGSGQYASIVQNTKLPLGSKWYIYLAPDGSGNPGTTFVMSQNPPPWLTALNVSPGNSDGKLHFFSNTYGALQTLGDPMNEWGVHDHFFMSIYNADGSCPGGCPPNQINGSVDTQYNNQVSVTDMVSFRPGSGANLNLGGIEFDEFVHNNALATGPEGTNRN